MIYDIAECFVILLNALKIYRKINYIYYELGEFYVWYCWIYR